MQKRKRLTVFLFLLVTALVLSGCSGSPASDLSNMGTVSGTVTDFDSGAPLTDAVVTVGDKTDITGTDGKYLIEQTAGTYNLKAEKENYGNFVDSVTITKGNNTPFDVAMTTTGTGTVSGIVTDGRGGPVVEGVTIRIKDSNISTTTDLNGEFHLAVAANQAVELLVEAENLATMRIQAVKVAPNEELFIEIPTRDIFNPNWSAEPPIISLNIQPDQVLTGQQEIEVSVAGERSTYLIYAYLGGDHRDPRTLFETNTDVATVSVDTTAFPNGESFLKVLVYDDNDNGALYIIPVTINNAANDAAVPTNLTYLEIASFTYGQNVGFYSKQINDSLAKNNVNLEIENIINAAPPGASSSIQVKWDPVNDADGYAIYRAFGELQAGGSLIFGDYNLFSRVPATQTQIYDYSTQITANVPMMYKVVPYNSFGEGNGMERMVMPLPAFNVYLETPANQANDVSLNPTFTWRNELSGGQFIDGIQFYSEISIFDGTDYQIWADTIENANTYTLNGMNLEPNGVYSWDISYSYALITYEYEANGYSYAYSIAGEYDDYDGTGSINGEYIFSTTTTVQ